jgi:ATP-binding cassette subfamily B protein
MRTPVRLRSGWGRVRRVLADRSFRQPEPAIEDIVPPEGFDGRIPHVPETPEEPIPAQGLDGAWRVLRRGLGESPEFRAGFGYTVALAVALAMGRMLIPILIQQIFDRGLRGPGGFRPSFVYTASAIVAGAIAVIYFLSRALFRRLVRASENALAGLRVRTFEHIHRLSIAEQTQEKRGAFVALVTSDVDILGQFLEWGAFAWFVSPTLMLGALIGMFLYSWQLALIVLVVIAPLFLVLRTMQRGMIAAYDTVRTRVGEMMSEVSEALMGAAVVRAYGLEERTNRRVKDAIHRRYKAEMHGAKYMASIFPLADLFGAAALSAVIGVGALYGPEWGLSVGRLVAFVFLVTLFLEPLTELSETFDMTQTAIAGWRKVLAVLDLPLELTEPSPGVVLPDGPLSVVAEGIEFGYRDGGGLVLRGIDVDVPAGSHVAIVGETGCGKTTFAKLLSRLADPARGRFVIGGVDLREVATESRRTAVRMVPQDGFLFDATIRENVRYGREGATDLDVEAAFEELGLGWWVKGLPEGLDTPVGERGENLSVGERQLVALARAQIAGPGLLILDEATSAVDPETERALGEALERLSHGRTTVTIAHRLSTAEDAEQVLVFDRGRIVERGVHAELVAAGGVYASLYQSWLGNTRAEVD